MKCSTILRLRWLSGVVLASLALGAPVEFRFTPPPDESIKNPFARELWAGVITPSGRTLNLPAFYLGDHVYAVRARADEAGTYSLGDASDTTGGRIREHLAVTAVLPAKVVVKTADRVRLPPVGLNPRDPHGFARGDGRLFFPVGANVAWPEGDCVPFYQNMIAAFSRANLNWMRVWMVHWGSLNLDWIPDWAGNSPKPGGIDGAVAQRWDDLLAAAEAHGVYLQIVVQHHGQYTTGANSNWADNPWNAARPGGFLKSPEDFFTDPRARLLTALKYRYIVARWGWSPAVFAWELFNEVNWVDSVAHGHEADVAQWHDDMAALIRSVDVYRHMVTTSTSTLRSPVFRKMDFYQPHLYDVNMLAGAREFEPTPQELDRPVFYGEEGDDKMQVDDAARKAGLAMIPPVWASLMGEGMLAAQPWEGAKLQAEGRLDELGAVNRFAVLGGLLTHRSSKPFSAVVETGASVPLQIADGQEWARRAAPELTLPTDGREIPEAVQVPGILVGSRESLADGFPGHATYHVTFPRAATVTVHVKAVGAGGGALRVSLDGLGVLDEKWPPGAGGHPPLDYRFDAAAGAHVLVLENPGGADWVELSGIDLGLEVPAIAAIGRRDDAFLALWLWRRDGLFAPKALSPLGGTLLLDQVPAGTWLVTWWDTIAGRAGQPSAVQHTGGTLRLPVPPFARHEAVILARQP